MAKRRATRNTSYRKRAAKKQSSRFIWLLGGMVIGVLIPSYFFLKTPTSTQDIRIKQSKIQEDIINPHEPLAQSIAKKIRPKHPTSSQQANYEFYNLLSCEEDTKPRQNEKEQNTTKIFTLNIASLKTFDKADALKAQLSLMGIEKVAIVKSDRNYRVIAGPYSCREDATAILKQLKDNDLSGKVVEKCN